MEHNKDQSDAAVRGEAVALTPADALTDAQIENFWLYRDCMDAIRAGDISAQFVSAFRAGMKAIDFSARAADAPSEPSEPLLTMAQVNAIRDTIKPGDGWDGDNWDYALANAVAAKVKSRAADALDSQPTEPDALPPLPEPIEVGGEGWDFEDFKSEKTFSREHMWAYARAAIASSQPTAPTVTPHHIELIQDMLIWPVTEDDARTARDMLQELHFDLSMASSQPTDGGVRNG